MTFGKNTMPFLAGLRLDSRLWSCRVVRYEPLHSVWSYKKRWDFPTCVCFLFPSIFCLKITQSLKNAVTYLHNLNRSFLKFSQDFQ